MKLTQNINFGFAEMLYPFRYWLKDIKYYQVSITIIGDEREIEIYFLDGKKEDITSQLPDNEEVNNICKKYYSEKCLYDLIHNILIEPIVENMNNFGYNFIEEEF